MAYFDYYNFARTYRNNSIMLFDKYVNTEGFDVDEERNYFVEHYVDPLLNFLGKLNSQRCINYFFNVSFMKLDIVNDAEFVDKEFNRDYFASMYLAKFTLDAYNNEFKKGTFGDIIASIIYLFDKGRDCINDLDIFLDPGYKIIHVYQDYIDNYVMKRKRRKMIRKDIENIFKEINDSAMDIMTDWDKKSLEKDTGVNRLDKLKTAVSKYMSLIKTIAIIKFEFALNVYREDEITTKCKLYKDMWSCRWDLSFNKVKVMNDFSFMFYRVYYWFVG